MGKKRGGGGAKAFMKAVMSKGDGNKNDEEQNEPVGQPAAPQVAAEQAAEMPNAQLVSSARETQADAAPADAPAEVPRQESRGQMQQRHKRELKAVKDAVKKLGKKRKEEGEKLEEETTQRHAAELAALDAGAVTAPPADGSDMGSEALVAQSLYGLSVAEDDRHEGKKESSRAQKRREKAAQQQAEREARIAAEQAEMGDSERQVEEAELARLLAPQGLVLRDIQPDGNCLYRAVEDQLAAEAGPDGAVDHDQLRSQAAEYMRAHEKEFAPFVLPEVAEACIMSCAACARGAALNPGGRISRSRVAVLYPQEAADGDDAHEQFQRYCDSMAGSAVWGGQAELGALAHVLRRRIDVYSVGMPTVAMGEEYTDDGPTLRVSYQRHAYELGEHYNSVVPAKSGGAALANGLADDADSDVSL